MKSIVLCLSAIVIFAASCSKNNTATATGRDAFVGNYHMHDSINYVPGASNDESVYYDMVVTADPNHSDRVIFRNIAGYGQSDTALVSGTIASFTVCPSCTTAREVTTATLSGTTIRLSGGYYETISGYQTYASGTGTKF
ncbi:MAG: hypothetical protein JST76_00615 [Bacteroidetes bacterium]|nr:hypothetical protein [Bacteroidota bacterium]